LSLDLNDSCDQEIRTR